MDKREIIISKYKEDKHDQMQNVCLKTASSWFSESEEQKQLLYGAYCNYYIEQEPENCFTALDGETVAGYIICTENAEKWAEDFERLYIKNLENSNTADYLRGTMVLPLKYAKDYPAHLHIDILDEYQRMGIGFKLMDALINHLKEKCIKGLMLSVDRNNEKGVNFYKKYGFEVVEDSDEGLVLGIKL